MKPPARRPSPSGDGFTTCLGGGGAWSRGNNSSSTPHTRVTGLEEPLLGPSRQ
jgi:hypothetical protein